MPDTPSRVPVPLPFVRQTMTIAPPWDPESAITVELLILATDYDYEGPGLLRANVPELQQGGWISHGLNGMDVNVRIIG